MAAIHRLLAAVVSVTVTATTITVVAASPALAAATVCAQYCDNRDPSLSRQDTFPLPTLVINGRQLRLHVSDLDGMAWGSIDAGTAGQSVWLDRSYDGGATWDGLLGKASIPGSWTDTRTLMFNVSDPSHHRRGLVRVCGDAGGVACSGWYRTGVCNPACDNATGGTDAQPAVTVTLSGRSITLHFDAAGMAWGTITNGRAGDEVWLDRSFDGNRVAFPAGARSSDPIDGHFISRSIDDTAWWGLTWIDAYDLTRDAAYLNEAVTIANYVAGSWDPSTCGGGVWWDRERTYKNAVTIGLYLRLTAALHNRIAGDTAWLNRAVTGWNWFTASGLINPSGLVNDGLTTGCQNNGQQVWTYNQGLAIGAATELYRATGNAAHLDSARRLGTAALSSTLVRNGVLTESCDVAGPSCDDNQKQFKGVFMRYLIEAGTQFQSFADTQASTLWSGRDPLNRVSSRWASSSSAPPDWRTQAAALSALLVAS